MSSSSIRSPDHKLPPLRESAAQLASRRPADRSTTSNPENIVTLVERFDEPIREGNRLTGFSEPPLGPSTAMKPTIAASGQRFAGPQGERNGKTASPVQGPMAAPVAKTRTGLPIKGLISALVGIALFATAILFVLLWQDTMRPHGGHGVPPAEGSSVASRPGDCIRRRLKCWSVWPSKSY